MNRDTTPTWKRIAKSLTPPVAWQAAASVAHTIGQRRGSTRSPGEQDPTYYNNVYDRSVEYRKHYTASQYYFIWCVIVDRLKRAGAQSVLDIGCGAGQFGSLLRDAGIPTYCGLDLSENAILIARTVCPEYKFVAENVFDTDLLEQFDYDTVISMEFLEHVNEDVAVLNRIRHGKRFFGTVPNFPYESHVRHFSSCEQVAERYGSLFTQFTVDALLANDNGMRFFLLEGVKA